MELKEGLSGSPCICSRYYRTHPFVTVQGNGRGRTNAYIKGSGIDVGADIFARGLCLPSDNENDRVFCFATEYMSSLEKCSFDKNWFGTPTVSQFSGYPFYFPKDSSAILEKIYGDYLTLPPVSKRVNKHEISSIRKVEQ